MDAHVHAIGKNKRYVKLDGPVQLSPSCAPLVLEFFMLLSVSEVTHHENRPRHDGGGGDVLDICSKSDVDSAFK